MNIFGVLLLVLFPAVCSAASLVWQRAIGDELVIVNATRDFLSAKDPAIVNAYSWPKVGYGDTKLAVVDGRESGGAKMLIAKAEGISSGPKITKLWGQWHRSYSISYTCWIKPLKKTNRTVAVFVWHVNGAQKKILTQYLGALDVKGHFVRFSTPLNEQDREGAYSFHVFELDELNFNRFEYVVSEA